MTQQFIRQQIDFQAAATGGELDVLVHDDIGDSWWGDGLTSKAFAQNLKEAGKVSGIHVRINSLGGNVFDGIAIHNMLAAHEAPVRVTVEGVAASAASIIAMAGDTIDMPKNSFMMIHNASTYAVGNAEEIAKTVATLNKIDGSLAKTYADRTGQPIDRIKEMLAAETWLTAEEAKSLGFATTISDEIAIAARAIPDVFKNIPEAARTMFVRGGSAPVTEIPKMSIDKTAQAAADAQAKADELAAANAKVAADKAVTDQAAAEQSAADQQQAAITAAVAAENKRVLEISALCETAGCPEKAKDFVKQTSATIETVRAALFDILCAKNVAVGDAPDAQGQAASDPSAKYAAEYDHDRQQHVEAGVTKEMWIAMRRIDDGLDSLTPKIKPALAA